MKSFLNLCLFATLGLSLQVQAQDVVRHVTATVETTPVPHSGDAADDSVIWTHPTDISQSVLVGTDKQGGIAVYELSGQQRSYLSDGELNNIDIRYGFSLNGQSTPIIAASNRSNNGISVYKIDVNSRALVNIAARTISTGMDVYGFCMYRSASSGKSYAFINSKSGVVQQWEFFESAGKVDAKMVRSFDVGSQVEGCVADDELGHFYIGEESVGIWKYGAEPTAGTTRTSVDKTSGHISADVEGLSIYHAANGQGYLIASSQGNNRYVIYERAGTNAYAASFDVVDGSIDGVSDTDGIKVVSFGLGSLFPEGVFIAQDGSNNGANQNYKLVPWGSIARAAGLRIDTSQDPRKVGGVVIPPGEPTPQAPNAPSNLIASAISTSQIRLQFNDNSNNEDEFIIERSLNNVNFSVIMELQSGPAMFTDSGLSASTRYYYRVRASNAVGSSANSNVANAVTLAETTPEPPTSTPGKFIFNVAEDACVRASKASQNFGQESSLESDKSPNSQVYLKFNVSGISGTVQSAKLRVYVTNRTSNGPEIYRTANTWNESSITWNNKSAAISSMLADKSKVAVGWQEYEVKAAILANGTYSFAVIADSTDGMDFASKQSANPAQLVITVSP